MPQVRLHLYEASGYELPRVCLRCGRPAREFQTLEIAWFPMWVNWLMLLGIVPYLIVAPILTKKATLNAPFCERHQYHWHVRTLAIAASLAVFLAAMYASLKWYPPLLLAVLFVLFPLIVVFVAIVHRSSVRPTEVTATHLVIDGVCNVFVDALVQRDQAVDREDGLDEVLSERKSSEAIKSSERRLPPSDAIEE